MRNTISCQQLFLKGLCPLAVLSHMQSGGVVFADGIEVDHLSFDWGRRLEVRVAERRLNLVRG